MYTFLASFEGFIPKGAFNLTLTKQNISLFPNAVKKWNYKQKKKKGEDTKRQLDHEAHNTLMPAHVMANISLLWEYPHKRKRKYDGTYYLLFTLAIVLVIYR